MAREDDTGVRAVHAGRAIYRCVLRLYPHAFQSRFADELEDDFLSMSEDAWHEGGAVALCRWWVEAGIDGVRSLGREWLHTPWMPIAVVSSLIAAGVFWAAMGRAELPLEAFRSRVVPGTPPPPESPMLLLVMGVMVLIPIAGVLLFWGISRLIRHDPRRRRLS